MRRFILLTLLLAPVAAAQTTVAPTTAPVGPTGGENTGNYNVVNSIEVGYRFRDVNGDLGTYRSDVNYGSGLRLLGGMLRVNSRDGRGTLFDEILLRTQGLGNDPYEFSSLHVEKNRLYSYDLTWRRNDYYNPGLATAVGSHLLDTQRRWQDHDLTLLPQSRFKLFVGYSRNVQEGPALSTTHLFDPASSEFPLFENISRLENEYRLGGEVNLLGFRFTVLHGWVNYSEHGLFSVGAPTQAGGATLADFRRGEPYRGSSPYWRLNLHKEEKTWAANARFSYAGSRRSFLFDETAIGLDRLGAGHNLQTAIVGRGSRPVSTGNLNLSFFPTSKLSVTNQTSFYNTRMDGDNSFIQLDNATLALQYVSFEFLGIRSIANTTDLSYRIAKWFGVYTGYHFSTRRIHSLEAFQVTEQPLGSLIATQTNDLHSGLVGLRIEPVRAVTLNLDAEIGRASRPIFPISERNYHALGGRVQYKAKSLRISASVRSNYNINSISVTEHSSRSRNYSADVSWTPSERFGIDASYSKLHLNTLSGIAYFAANPFRNEFITGDHSIYVSNIHTGVAMAHIGITSRVDLSAGYSRVQDVGDGRDLPAASTEGGSALPVFLAAQTFPLTYESPLARLSVKLHEKLRWNAGYQFYHYKERFQPGPRYGAHTGYASLLWSF